MLIAIFQLFCASLSWFLLKLFTDFQIKGTENLKDVDKPFIVVANHESHLDPQLTGVALLWRPTLFPLRYMAKNELFRVPGLNVLIWLLGAFKAHRKQGLDRSLLTPRRILEKGGAVIMFPEGRIIASRPQLGEGRRGAAILALTTKTVLVPMSLHTPPELTPWRFLTTHPRVVINIGAPFCLNKTEYSDLSDESVAKATDEIMQKIATLYYQHDYGISSHQVSEHQGN